MREGKERMDARMDANGEYEWTKTNGEGREGRPCPVPWRPPARACGGGNEEPPGSPWGLDRGEPYRVERRRATLPHPLRCSTIAVQGLSFRVRNGTGRLTLAMVAANLQPITTPPGGRWHVAVREPDNGREFVPWTKRMLPAGGTSRRTQYGQHQKQHGVLCDCLSPVSTGQLHPLRGFHVRPIDHVFCMGGRAARGREES